MVKKFERPAKGGRGISKNIQADIIILGCSLPGIVTAHKLKRKFGNTMDIVILDMAGSSRVASKCNVSFFTDFYEDDDDDREEENVPDEDTDEVRPSDNVARYYLTKYARNFKIPIPEALIEPKKTRSTLNKLFQHTNGSTVEFSKDFHDFHYLSFLEKFELNQYQNLLDHSMKDIFHTRNDSESERKRLLYYDKTTMEQHLCSALLFSTSRDIMRTIIGLVCGAPADSISVLFYLHQCFRSNSARNHIDGDNMRFREKILGYCRKRLANQLQESIADITLPVKTIESIRSYSEEQVILQTIQGETNYICNLLAMALRPDELRKIQVEDQLLLHKQDVNATKAMSAGRARKFAVRYEENFWEPQGYSGDILSIQGPIIWAMEKPKLSTTGSQTRFATLVGYLMVSEETVGDSKEAVLEQLVKLFGPDAAKPTNYQETDVTDIFVPRCGDYVALRRLTAQVSRRHLEWGALDVFADGDLAAALEAGHLTYLHLLSCLRPQAQTFEDLSSAEWPIVLSAGPLERWYSQINYKSSVRLVLYTAAIYIGVKLVQSYFRK